MRYFLIGLAIGAVMVACAASAQDTATPIDQSAPAKQIVADLTDLQAAKTALFDLSDRKQVAALDMTKKLTANIANLQAQIAEYKAAEVRMQATIAAYQQLYGPLP